MLDQRPGETPLDRNAPAVSAGANTTLAVVAAATLLCSLVFSAVTTTLRETAQTFGGGVDAQTWALGGMSLGLACTLLTAGALADVLGRRRVFLWSVLVLVSSSAMAALAPAMLVFVVARVLQGVAAAGVVAAGLGLIGHDFPAGPARTQATGMWGAMLAAGVAAGPILGPVLAHPAGWRVLYAAEAVAAVGVAAAGMGLLTASGGRVRSRRLDWPGSLTILLAMGGLTGGLTSGRTGWTSPVTVLLLLAGLAALGLFGLLESRRADPMLDLALLRRPLFRVSVGGAMVNGLGTIGPMTYSPTMLERGLRHSPLVAGGILAIWSLTSMLVSMQARRLPERLSSRGRLACGLLASGVGSAALAWLSTGISWWALVPGLVIGGVGYGLANAALARLAVESVPAARAALGSGANNTARYLGSALGIAVIVAIVSGGGSGPADMIDGWNHAALAAAGLNVAGAVLVGATGWGRGRRAVRSATVP
jgi:MFS family permease